MSDTCLDPSKIYAIKPRQVGGYNYAVDYHRGNVIHVRILEGPNELGAYKVTTRGQGGEHLGPGGGWTGDSILFLRPSDLEEIIK